MSHPSTLSYKQTRRLMKGATAPRAWRAVAKDFAGEVWPEFTPSFHLRPGEVVFTMGSCFARNIESHLAMLGCRVPMLDFDLPAEEWSGGAHGAMNRFHPPAFRQSLDWTAAIRDRDGKVRWEDCQAMAFDCGEGLYFDLDMGATAPVSKARFLERRQHVFDVFSTVFQASCLMMTPGLIEAWKDRTTGLYIHMAPRLKEMLNDPDRWEFEVLPYETCHADLLAAIDVVRARNPEVKILLTTSPVPLTSTFTTQDVRVANSYSKSVLRAVCGAVIYERPMVDYFPSYESVSLSFPKGVWKDDHLHVTHGFIAKIVTRMLDRYLEGVDEADRNCQRARTHLLNKNFKEAEQAAEAALRDRPDHIEAAILRADAMIRQGRAGEAEAALRELVQRHPERAELRIALARALAGGGDRIEEAADQVEAALALPSLEVLDLRTVSDLTSQLADAARAEQIARRMLELFPLHVEIYPPLIDLLTGQRRRAEAIEVLERALSLRRAPVEMYVQLASLLAKTGRMQEALVQLGKAQKMDADHPGATALSAKFAAQVQADASAPVG